MAGVCDICEEGTMNQRLVDHKFAYGSGEDEVILEAKVLVFECGSCGEALMGWEGLDAMEKAILQHRASLDAA